MRRRILLTIFAALLGLSLVAGRASACPYCKVAPGGMAAEEEMPDDGQLHLKFSGGFDFPTSYYFRGYLQADHGPILQAYANVFTVKHWGEAVVRPYVSLFNSTHWGDNNPMPEMSDVMLGATIDAQGILIDFRYAFFDANPVMHSAVNELGVKVSTELLGAWQDPEAPSSFGLRPYFGIYAELDDEEDDEQTYVALGIEPTYRTQIGCRDLGLSVPLEWGLSPDGYYTTASGEDEGYGYFSTTISATLTLPKLGERGEWFLNASFQYLHLNADSAITANRGVQDAYIGKLGLAFIF